MAEELLGPAFEIHGGGLDLVFPHHENEVAQSRALGHPFAHIWAHNGLLRFTGEKMSKSSGNVATIREVLDEWGREAILVFFLTASWRKPIDFSPETMQQAAARRDTLAKRVHLRRPLRPTRRAGRRSPLRSTTISTRPPRSPCFTTGPTTGSSTCSGAGSPSSGSSRSPSARRRRSEVVELAERRAQARAEQRLRDVRPPARRAGRARLADARRARRRLHAGP